MYTCPESSSNLLFTGGDQWPGFDTPVIQQESLWDNSVPPQPTPEPWQSVGMSSSPTAGLWGDTQGMGTGWTSGSSIWSAGSPIPATSTASGTGSPVPMAGATSETSPDASAMTGFDPFNTLGSIWNPANPATSSAGWGFPPKPDEEQN